MLVILFLPSDIDSDINPSLNQQLAAAYGAGRSFQIEDFTYHSDALTDLIFNRIKGTSFSGITVCSFTRILFTPIACIIAVNVDVVSNRHKFMLVCLLRMFPLSG